MSAAVNSAVNKSISGLNTLKKQSDDISRSAFGFARSAGAMGLALGAPIVGAVKSAADFEKLAVSLEVLTGSAEKGKRLYQQLVGFARDTPFELGELVKAQKTMMGFGMSSDTAYQNLRILGDVAAVTGGDLGGIVLAFSQASAKGKLMAQDINQLIDNGVPVIDMLAKSMGVANNRVKQLAEEGKITYPVMVKAFQQATSEGGKFHNGMIRLSETAAGKFAKIKDDVILLGVKIGNILIPAVKALLDRVMPVLDAIGKWTDKNPELTKRIVMVATAASALLLVLSGVGFIVGGVAQAVSIGATVFVNLAKALRFVGQAVVWLGRLFLTNPILLAITAIAVGVYLIIRHWGAIRGWFSRLWDNIKRIFRTFIQFVANFAMMIHPMGLVIRHWDKIVPFFRALWEKVKAIFNAVWEWLVNLHTNFFSAGKNIIMSIWEGMKAVAMKPVEVVKDIAKKIREYLPFSPAKVGPLRDIHRIRLIETIAEGIKPTALVNAMHRTAQMAFDVIPKVAAGNGQSPAFAGGGNRVNLQYSPVLNMGSGGAAGGFDLNNLLNQHARHITNLVVDQLARRDRLKY